MNRGKLAIMNAGNLALLAMSLGIARVIVDNDDLGEPVHVDTPPVKRKATRQANTVSAEPQPDPPSRQVRRAMARKAAKEAGE